MKKEVLYSKERWRKKNLMSHMNWNSNWMQLPKTPPDSHITPHIEIEAISRLYSAKSSNWEDFFLENIFVGCCCYCCCCMPHEFYISLDSFVCYIIQFCHWSFFNAVWNCWERDDDDEENIQNLFISFAFFGH
jgi:hypothetical protein